jgi:hypothetical protein
MCTLRLVHGSCAATIVVQSTDYYNVHSFVYFGSCYYCEYGVLNYVGMVWDH